jgi:filamentous hemagglutinin family protein
MEQKIWGFGKHLAILNLAFLYILVGETSLKQKQIVLAQIVPDNTLGEETSIVTFEETSSDRIEGGATRGSNLFHSFSEFNVNADRSVYFNNPAGIENIFSRVTGNNSSDISGKLGVDGSANLFLINPNGILFGANASLDLKGSFVASTARSLIFDNGFAFDTANPQSPPLLTINVPIGLQFGSSPGKIINYANPGLQLSEYQTLALIGGEINFIGGSINVPSGRMELGSVAGGERVNLTPVEYGFAVGYEGVQNFADIELSDLAKVDASWDISNSQEGGDYSGSGGEIAVQARNVKLTGGSQILSNTFGEMDGGSIFLSASESVELSGSAGIDGPFDSFFSQALGIKIPIKTSISTTTFGKGSSGNISINTQKLLVRDGGEINAESSGEGNGGTLFVRASGSVEVAGETPIPQGQKLAIPPPLGFPEQFFITINATSNLSTSSSVFGGSAGNLSIDTGNLIVRDGALISTNPFGPGNGGNLAIKAGDSIILRGNSLDGVVPSVITTTAFGSGNAGNLMIQTGKLTVSDGGFVVATTTAAGKGGNLKIDARQIELIGADGLQTGISAGSTGSGNAGDLTLTTDRLIIRDGAELQVNASSTGSTGQLSVSANSLELDNGKVTAESASGNGGNINLDIRDILLLRDRSSISTTAGTQMTGGNGGNINLNANFIVAIPQENSDISANAFSGNGGNIQIASSNIFGIEFRSEPTNLSDITVSSKFGIDGVVELNLLEIDPSQNLVALPTEVVDASRLIAQNCSSQLANDNKLSEFVITGRGGLPPNPTGPLKSDSLLVGWVERDLSAKKERFINVDRLNSPQTIVEARGWLVKPDGQIILAIDKNEKSVETYSYCQ